VLWNWLQAQNGFSESKAERALKFIISTEGVLMNPDQLNDRTRRLIPVVARSAVLEDTFFIIGFIIDIIINRNIDQWSL
jgi:hypothetical protein